MRSPWPGSLGESSFVDKALSAVGLSDTKSDEVVRVRTISEITKAASGVPLHTLVRDDPATAATFTADGVKFAIGYGDGTIMVGRVDRAGTDTRLAGHTARVWAVSFSPDGKSLASASSHEVLLWDLDRGEAQPLCGAGSNFTDVAFDPSGKYLAWSSHDGPVTVRNMTDLAVPIVPRSTIGIGDRF